MSSSKAFNINEAETRPFIRVCTVNPNYDVFVVDMNGVSRQVPLGDTGVVFDGETVRASAKHTPSHSVETVYKIQREFYGKVYDAMDVVFAPPIRYWRKDRFFIKGPVECPTVGHLLVSMS